MRYTILMLLLLVPGIAKAQSLGCAIEFNNPNICSNKVVTCTGDTATDLAFYGFTIADLCDRLSISVNTGNNILAHWKACGDTNDQIRGAIGFWEGLTHYYEGLTARLRSKCGKKCRGVN